uniref:Esterase n=1 Tax=Caenorhabditis tropicalis TaxID=1561998 RepID=A0A1I7T1A7_9PELO
MGTINTLAYLIKLRWKSIDCVLFPVLDWFYNDFVGLRVADGKVSAAAILPMQTFAFEKQKASMDEMRKKPWVRMFYAYGSKDFLVEESDSEELAMYFKGDHYVIHDKKEAEEAIPKIWNSYARGQSYVTANFTEEGHYLQKTYPEFLIQVLGGIFDVETDNSK